MLKPILLILSTFAAGYWYENKLCYLRECCHPNDGTGYLNYEKGCDKLLLDLRTKVFGQPLIIDPIYKSLREHVTNDKPSRPLVFYFSGWTGTGKTHVAKLIAENLYKEGMRSRFVKYISSSYHFPIKIEGVSEIMTHRERLRKMIRDTVSTCERSLIILDELDKLPSGVVDGLQPLLDYVEDIDGIRYKKAVFIFLSNTGSDKLFQLAYKMYGDGKERKDLSRMEMHRILMNESFHEQGGLGKSSILKRYSIGVFVPFLPLERSHVDLCIREAIESISPGYESADSIVDEIADEMIYFPEEVKLYSESGCKGVREKVVNYISPIPMTGYDGPAVNHMEL